jgi:hypothetical protein
VAWWNAVPNTAMEYGHVAFVDKINWKSNGEVESIKVSEYNFSEKGKPGSRPLYPNTKDYPDGFLYIVTDEFLECDLTDLCQPKKKSTSTTGAGMGGSVSGSAPSASSKKAVVFIKQLYIEGYKIRFFPEEKEKVCAVVGNNGKEPKNDVKVIFERSKGTKIDPKPKEIGKENIKHGNIKKGATKTECTSFTVPNDPGEKYNIRACAKFDGSTSCSNPLVYEIKERPKLSIEYFYLLNEDGGLKATFSSGENLLASAGIKNSGGDVEEDVKVGFEILNSSRKVIASGTENIRDYNLEKGEKKKESHIFTVPAPGNYTAKVCADPSNKVQEDNEKDNCKETSFRAVSP